MQLKYLNGTHAGETVEIDPPGICVGRETDNDLQLLVAGVSRYHAKIMFDGYAWKVSDTGSTNGTFVNGCIINDSVKLQPGDLLEFGDQKMQFGEAAFGAGVTPLVEEKQKADATARSMPRPSDRTANHPLPDPFPPPQKPAPEPEKKPLPEKAATPEKKSGDAENLLEKLKKSKSLFNGKENQEKHPEEDGTPSKKKTLFSGRLGNVIFTLLLVMLALVAIFFFLTISDLNEKAAKNSASVRLHVPDFLLVYEKVKITNDNVFRFSIQIEDGKAEICLDDLKYQRHPYRKITQIKKNSLKMLEDSIRETGFMKLEQINSNAVQTGEEQRRKLLISLDGAFNRITVSGKYAQTSFEQVEQAIDRFAEEYGFRIDSLSVDEILKEARNAFAIADRKLDNWKAHPANLRESIERFRLAIEYLDQFDPKPEEWNLARKRMAEAKKIYDAERQNIVFQIQRYNKLKQYDKAADACRRAMEMLEPGSKGYQNAKKYKLYFEKELRRR